MTPLEATKRLMEANESGLLPSDADGNCWYCFWHLLHDGSGHDPDCPWPVLPRIVAVLDVVERIAAYHLCHQCGARRPEHRASWCETCQIWAALSIGDVAQQDRES